MAPVITMAIAICMPWFRCNALSLTYTLSLHFVCTFF